MTFKEMIKENVDEEDLDIVFDNDLEFDSFVD